MPKKIYNNFLGGIAPFSDKIGLEGSYAESRSVDIHREPGYIMPGWIETVIDESGDVAPVIESVIIDMANDPAISGNMYVIDAGGSLYKLLSITDAFTKIRDNSVSGATRGEGVVSYKTNIAGTPTNKLFYIYEDDAGVFNFDVTPEAGDFDDDWLSTVPADAASLNDNPHPYIIGEDQKLYIGDGNILKFLDGNTGANGTFDPAALDLPAGWEITSLFKIKDYLGICANLKNSDSIYYTESAVYFWDYVSESFNSSIPVVDNRINASKNVNGTVYLLTSGRQDGNTLRRLTNNGTELIKKMEFKLSGNDRSFKSNGRRNIMDVSENRLLFLLTSTIEMAVFAYGSTDPSMPKVISQPFSAKNGSGASVGFLRNNFSDDVYVSYKDGTDSYISKFYTSGSTFSFWKGLYTEPGTKIRINWVKIHTKPLTTSDALTLTLEVDGGTSKDLVARDGSKTLTFSADGAATVKKFYAKYDCHRFRPVINWDGGTPAVSSMVIDYSIISDV